MKLRDVCEKTGISKRNIHFYIKEEILHPERDETNGYYIFSEEDCSRLAFIRYMRYAGFSIARIRSVLDHPATAGYYFNRRIKEMKAEIAHLEVVLGALSHVQKHLLLHVRYSQLEALVSEAVTQAQRDCHEVTEIDFSEYDVDLVNRCLWESFIPDLPMTDYQEYLWNKVIRYSREEHAGDYQLISSALHQFTGEQIEKGFSGSKVLFMEAVRLSPEEYGPYMKRMLQKIEEFLDNPRAVAFWRRYYQNLVVPSIRIYNSDIALTMEELSSTYRFYREVMNGECALAYKWLMSDEGTPLLRKMQDTLGSDFDIHHHMHEELQAMVIIGGRAAAATTLSHIK